MYFNYFLLLAITTVIQTPIYLRWHSCVSRLSIRCYTSYKRHLYVTLITKKNRLY